MKTSFCLFLTLFCVAFSFLLLQICECKDSAFVSLPLQNCPLMFASWHHRHHLWIGLDDICTNFMPIKVRLLRQARSLSHSYHHCLNGVGCKRKRKPAPLSRWLLTWVWEGFFGILTVGDWGGRGSPGTWGLLRSVGGDTGLLSQSFLFKRAFKHTAWHF